MRVAVLANLKRNAPHQPDEPPDAWAELDSEETVEGIARALEAWGHTPAIFEGNLDLPEALRRFRPDICFNICEGYWGDSREAHVPAMLEMMRIPYTGSRVLALAISLDKAMTKRVWMAEGLPTPPFQVFRRPDEPLDPRLSFPLFVKPNREGSGMGISAKSVVTSEAELREQVAYILRTYRQEALVETFIDGPELTVGLIGNVDGEAGWLRPPGGWATEEGLDIGGVHVFPPMMVDLSPCPPDQRGLYTSYIKSEMPLGPRYLCPAPLDPTLRREAQRLAFEAFRAIGACDLSRVDMRIDAATGRIYLLEINTLPGLNPRYSDMVLNARADGMAYDVLIARILEAACRRYGLPIAEAVEPARVPLRTAG
ncbi:hypothetical protein [Thermoflexus sp.]|uniref:D-alanine--D-alanine ligase family protein n=1 Tax=Thermoflexus sp. TaxID=1969742 RepID=UPI001770A81E|nr:hypothetical protein [Thermoflexus sp.]